MGESGFWVGFVARMANFQFDRLGDGELPECGDGLESDCGSGYRCAEPKNEDTGDTSGIVELADSKFVLLWQCGGVFVCGGVVESAFVDVGSGGFVGDTGLFDDKTVYTALSLRFRVGIGDCAGGGMGCGSWKLELGSGGVERGGAFLDSWI